MNYVKVEDGSVSTYPYSIKQLKSDNKNVSFPTDISANTLADFGVYSVTVESDPEYNENTHLLQPNDAPTLADGAWKIGWTVTERTSEQISERNDLMASVNRKKRNTLLSETDFYALSDVTMSSEMTTYRQSLRDLPTHSNWPHLEDSDWPAKP